MLAAQLLQKPKLHRNGDKATFDGSVPQRIKILAGFGVVQEIAAPQLAARSPNRALCLLKAPFPKQGLAQAQHAIAVVPFNMVEFFKAELHAGTLACNG